MSSCDGGGGGGGRLVQFGPRSVQFPSASLRPLLDSSELLHHSPPDTNALQNRLNQHGYILIRNLIPRELVLKARGAILEHMNEQDALDTRVSLSDANMSRGAPALFNMEGFDGIATDPAIKGALECKELFRFFRDHVFDGEDVRTFDYKWIRGVGNDRYTGVHCDNVYMGRGTERLYTVWIPLGDTDVEEGTLAMCEGSNSLPSYEKIRTTYGQLDVDRDKTEGWISMDPFEISNKYGGQWRTADFNAGDVLIFSMHTLHASTTNTSNRYRLSCDVRFMPEKDEADERWIISNETQDETNEKRGKGHTCHGKETLRSMEIARKEWGI